MKHYIFKGSLCGLICPECPEPLSNVKVRLYRLRAEQNVRIQSRGLLADKALSIERPQHGSPLLQVM